MDEEDVFSAAHRISRNVALTASTVLTGDQAGYHRAMNDVVNYRRRVVATRIKESTPRQAIQQSLARRLGGGARAPLLGSALLEDVPVPRTQHSLFQTFQVTKPRAEAATSAESMHALSVRKEMAASELLDIDERIAELRARRKVVFNRMADVECEQISDEPSLQHYYPRGERIKQIPAIWGSQEIMAIDFNSPFGQLALASGDRIALYELKNDKHVQLRGTLTKGKVHCLSVRGAEPVICAGAAHSVYIWRTADFLESEVDHIDPNELLGHIGNVIVVDDDGDTLVSSSLDSTVRQWDERLGKCSTTIDMFEFGMCRALQHEGSALATGTQDGVVRLFDLREPSSRRGIAYASRKLMGGHTRAVTALHFHGLELISGSADGSLRTWDLRNGQISSAESYPNAIESLEFDQAKVVIAVRGEVGVRVLSRPTGEHRINAIDDSLVTAARYMKGYLVTGRASGEVGVWAV